MQQQLIYDCSQQPPGPQLSSAPFSWGSAISSRAGEEAIAGDHEGLLSYQRGPAEAGGELTRPGVLRDWFGGRSAQEDRACESKSTTFEDPVSSTHLFPVNRVIMPGCQINDLMKPEEEHQAQRDEPVLELGQPNWSDEEDSSSSSSSCSFSLCSSWSSSDFLSSSSSYLSLSYSSLSSSSLPDVEVTEEEVSGELIVPPNIPSPVPSPCSGDSTAEMQAQGESSSHAGEGPSSVQGAEVSEPCGLEVLYGKVAEMVGLLLLKYISQELLSEADMLSVVCPDEPELLPVLFPQARECLELTFGIEVVELDPQQHTYVLVTSLDFRHAKATCPDSGMLQSCLLLFVLGVISREGDWASEEAILNALSRLGLQAGEQHAIFGDPRELLSNVWVQEQYLECRQVLGSDPPRSVFLWGPSAHAATLKVKVLEFWLSAKSRAQDSFHLLDETEKEEPAELGLQNIEKAGRD
ncbi:melanoma-associated antigen 8-like [Sorex araneus]|uniref:melanoma-associated antigen 8-like n=1 Tax=Sorex araneus TaxID=42254 RepID=UPI0024333A94|nr:melanoma-associated antigen 8-like [Sorex araneus]